MPQHYYAVRPISMPEHIRIEKAESPLQAAAQAFGRGHYGYEVKDLGTRVDAIRSDRQRLAMLHSPEGWVPLRRKNVV